MTREEAKECLRKYLQTQVNDEYPVIWIGDVRTEAHWGFIIWGGVYKQKYDNKEDYKKLAYPYDIFRETGEVVLPGGFTQEDAIETLVFSGCPREEAEKIIYGKK